MSEKGDFTSACSQSFTLEFKTTDYLLHAAWRCIWNYRFDPFLHSSYLS